MAEQTPAPLLTQAQRSNLETAKIRWHELQRYFAQGLLVVVNQDIDLVEIAAAFVQDNSEQIEMMLGTAAIRKA